MHLINSILGNEIMCMNGSSNREQFASVNGHNSISFPVTCDVCTSNIHSRTSLVFFSQAKTSLRKLITIAYWRKCKRLALIVTKTNFIILRSSKMKPDQSFDIKRDDERGLNFPSFLNHVFFIQHKGIKIYFFSWT